MANHLSLGRLGEDLAANRLNKEGYTILCRNFRRPCGEIDIIAAKEGVVYFVEVKTRQNSDYAPAADSVTLRKRRQIARTANQWFIEQGEESLSGFLVAEVYPERGEVVLIEDFLC